MQKLTLATAELSLETAASNLEQRGFLEVTALIPQSEERAQAGLQGAKEWGGRQKETERGEHRVCSHQGVAEVSASTFSSRGHEEGGVRLRQGGVDEAVAGHCPNPSAVRIGGAHPSVQGFQAQAACQGHCGRHGTLQSSGLPLSATDDQSASVQLPGVLDKVLQGEKIKVMLGTAPRAKKERDVLELVQNLKKK